MKLIDFLKPWGTFPIIRVVIWDIDITNISGAEPEFKGLMCDIPYRLLDVKIAEPGPNDEWVGVDYRCDLCDIKAPHDPQPGLVIVLDFEHF